MVIFRRRVAIRLVAAAAGAIGLDGATATEVGRRLGISKQAAAKTIERLEACGYATRAGDAADRRRKLVRLTPRGTGALAESAAIFSDIRTRWMRELGPGHVEDLEASLRRMAPDVAFRLDVLGWLGAS
jgi:DNA-binding MarR family transcriptional regulator